jgi:hypothetical protein
MGSFEATLGQFIKSYGDNPSDETFGQLFVFFKLNLDFIGKLSLNDLERVTALTNSFDVSSNKEYRMQLQVCYICKERISGHIRGIHTPEHTFPWGPSYGALLEFCETCANSEQNMFIGISPRGSEVKISDFQPTLGQLIKIILAAPYLNDSIRVTMTRINDLFNKNTLSSEDRDFLKAMYLCEFLHKTYYEIFLNKPHE